MRKHSDFALKVAKKSMVLLKNDGLLPLSKSKLKSIGVIGPNADSRAALEGNYSAPRTGMSPYWTVSGLR